MVTTVVTTRVTTRVTTTAGHRHRHRHRRTRGTELLGTALECVPAFYWTAPLPPSCLNASTAIVGGVISGFDAGIGTAPGTGQSRTFNVQRWSPSGSPIATGLSCTIQDLNRKCSSAAAHTFDPGDRIVVVSLSSAGAAATTMGWSADLKTTACLVPGGCPATP
jgi:hypothetical protein